MAFFHTLEIIDTNSQYNGQPLFQVHNTVRSRGCLEWQQFNKSLIYNTQSMPVKEAFLNFFP